MHYLGYDLTLVAEESPVAPGYVQVSLLCDPPPRGHDRMLYTMVKPPAPPKETE